MSVLSEEGQKKIEELLVTEKLLTADKVATYKKEATAKKQPFLTYLLEHEYITNEQLTKLNALVLGVPYVNLAASKINPSVLNLLPFDVADRFMAVPLGSIFSTRQAIACATVIVGASMGIDRV